MQICVSVYSSSSLEPLRNVVRVCKDYVRSLCVMYICVNVSNILIAVFEYVRKCQNKQNVFFLWNLRTGV